MCFCYEIFEKERKSIKKSQRRLEKRECSSFELASQENINLPAEYNTIRESSNFLTKPPSLLQQNVKAFSENYKAFLAKLKDKSPIKYVFFFNFMQ